MKIISIFIICAYCLFRFLWLKKIFLNENIYEGRKSYTVSLLCPFLFWALWIFSPWLSAISIPVFFVVFIILFVKSCSSKKYYINLCILVFEYFTIWIPSTSESMSLLGSSGHYLYFLKFEIFYIFLYQH